MKTIQLKGSVKRLTPAAPLLVAAAAALFLLPVRILQLANNTDMITGFFVRKDVFVYLFFVVSALSVIVVALLSYLCGNMPGAGQQDGIRPLSGVASLGLAAAFAYTAYPIITLLRSDAAATGLSLYEAAKLNGNLRYMVEMVFACIAAVAFVLYAVACFSGKRGWLRFVGILFLAAPMWGICRVITYFTRTISYLVVGELFSELYAAVFLMIFLFCFARMITETASEGGTWTVVASGLGSALFCLLASLPRLVTTLAGKGTVEDYGIDWLYIAGALFSIVGVLSTILKGLPENPPVEELDDSADDGDIEVKPFTVE